MSRITFDVANVEENIRSPSRSPNELFVCSSEILGAQEDELQKICTKFSGSTRTLVQLREKLNVKDFVQLLNNFPSLKKSEVECAARDNELNYHQISIHFEDFKGEAGALSTEEETSNSSTFIKKESLVQSTSDSNFSENESFTDHCDDCTTNYDIKELCLDIQKRTESSDEEVVEHDSVNEIIHLTKSKENIEAIEPDAQELSNSATKSKFSTKLIAVSAVAVVSTMLAVKFGNFNKF